MQNDDVNDGTQLAPSISEAELDTLTRPVKMLLWRQEDSHEVVLREIMGTIAINRNLEPLTICGEDVSGILWNARVYSGAHALPNRADKPADRQWEKVVIARPRLHWRDFGRPAKCDLGRFVSMAQRAGIYVVFACSSTTMDRCVKTASGIRGCNALHTPVDLSRTHYVYRLLRKYLSPDIRRCVNVATDLSLTNQHCAVQQRHCTLETNIIEMVYSRMCYDHADKHQIFERLFGNEFDGGRSFPIDWKIQVIREIPEALADYNDKMKQLVELYQRD